MDKFKLVIMADVSVPTGSKFAVRKVEKELKAMYAEYMPEDVLNVDVLPEGTKVGKVNVTLDLA